MDQNALIAPGLPAQALMLPLILTVAALAAAAFLGFGYWIHNLSVRLASQQQKIEQLENQVRPPLPETPGGRQPSSPDASKERYKVLYLNSLGYSAPEIAQEARLRVAEVNFILRADARTAAPSGL